MKIIILIILVLSFYYLGYVRGVEKGRHQMSNGIGNYMLKQMEENKIKWNT